MQSSVELKKLGGNYQLFLDSLEDLEHLWSLDESRWMASSAPINALAADDVFLKQLDGDANGRVRTDELKAAVKWTLHVLAKRDAMGSDVLRLDDLAAAGEGAKLRASAERVLDILGADDRATISLGQVRDRARIMASGATNGDGVIPQAAVDDPEVRQFVIDIGTALGFDGDASGKQGVTAAKLDAFLAHASAHLAWRELGVSDAVRFAGPQSDAAWKAYEAVRAKLDDFFALCQLSTFDSRVSDAVRLSKESLDTLGALDLHAKIRSAPLARPHVDGVLDPSGWLNPSWKPEWDAFAAHFAVETLDHDGWVAVQQRVAAYAGWQSQKKGAEVAGIAPERLQTWLDEPRFADALRQLIAADRAVAAELQQLAALERAVLNQRSFPKISLGLVSEEIPSVSITRFDRINRSTRRKRKERIFCVQKSGIWTDLGRSYPRYRRFLVRNESI